MIIALEGDDPDLVQMVGVEFHILLVGSGKFSGHWYDFSKNTDHEVKSRIQYYTLEYDIIDQQHMVLTNFYSLLLPRTIKPDLVFYLRCGDLEKQRLWRNFARRIQFENIDVTEGLDMVPLTLFDIFLKKSHVVVDHINI